MNRTHPAQRGLAAMTDQTVVASNQAAAVPANLSCVIYQIQFARSGRQPEFCSLFQ